MVSSIYIIGYMMFGVRCIMAGQYFKVILGNIACVQATLLHSGVIVNDLPEDSIWLMALSEITNY